MYTLITSDAYLENKNAFFFLKNVNIKRLRTTFATEDQSANSQFYFPVRNTYYRIALDVIVTDDAGIDITMAVKFKEQPVTSVGGYGSTNRDIYIYQDRYYYAKISEEYYQYSSINYAPYYEGQISSFYRGDNPINIGKLQYLERGSRFIQIVEPRQYRRFNLFCMEYFSFDFLYDPDDPENPELFDKDYIYLNIISGRQYIKEMQLLLYFNTMEMQD